MANQKFFYNNSGILTEKSAISSSAGAGSAGSIPCLDSSGLLDITMMPTGIGADTVVVASTEALTAGDFVNIYNSFGVKCRKADATTTGKEAHGFVLSAVTSGENATIYRQGTNSQLTGMTIGARQFLNTTAGGRTETAPTASGNVVQFLGIAVSATSMFFEERDIFVLA